MYGLEQKVFEQLAYLKKEFKLQGIKAEFEAEGSSFRDIMRLRRLTAKADVRLFLKIGGVEALRDIKDSLELGVDGLIAPMVETRFGVKKFVDAYKSIYKDHRITLSINIETENAIEEIDSILNFAENKIDNITLGRTDLSASYFDHKIIPDSDLVFKMIRDVGLKVSKRGMTFTVGGSISLATVEKFNQNPASFEFINNIETRKVVLPRDIAIGKKGAIKEALKFEELYILSKKELNDLFIESEVSRLIKLSRRL
jgi:hypothetical protein